MATLWDQKRGKYYDPWEEATPGQRTVHMRAQLEEIVSCASRLPFYQDRLSKVKLTEEHPLAEVPVLKAEDFRAQLPPKGRGAVNGSGYTVFQSGGTTGLPKTTLFSHEELEGLNLGNARGFYAVGLTPDDRVGNLWAVGSLYMTFVHINRMIQQYGCMNFPFSNHTEMDFIHPVVREFGINTLTGIASSTLNAVRALHRMGAEGIRIEKIFYGGEHFFEADKEEIRNKVGAEIIAAPGYGTVDTWYLGYQCSDCPTGVFHCHDDQVWLEIWDEERDGPTDGVGMLYATPFPRRVTPVVRYRVGDRARWVEPCRCGRTTPRFQLLGRGDDVLRIGYDSVDYGAVQEIVAKVPGFTGSIQLEKLREDGRDRLVVRVETELNEPGWTEAREKFEALLLESRPSLREFIQKGTVWPVRVESVAPGALPRNPKTGKLMRVVDVI